MKRQLSISALILALSVGLAWHNQQQLTASRAARARLLDQAASRGMTVDTANSQSISLPSKLPRPSREEEIKQLATSFIAYVDEMQPGAWQLDTSDPVVRDKITRQMDQLAGLDADQWEMFIHEVFTRTDDPVSYQGLIGLALHQMVKDKPERVMAILLDTPGLLDFVDWPLRWRAVSEAMDQMFTRDWDAALDWFIENRARMRPDLMTDASRTVIFKVGKGDPRLALKLMDEAKMEQPENLIPHLLSRSSPEGRNASLAIFREWRAEHSAPAGDETHRNTLAVLAFGQESDPFDQRADFAESAAWMAQAGLTAEEFGILGQNLANHIHLKDSGQWIGWLGEHLEEDEARDESKRIFSDWLRADYKAAGNWLADQPEFPGRKEMVREYVKKVSPRDPELAARCARDAPQAAPQDSSEGDATPAAGVGIGVEEDEDE